MFPGVPLSCLRKVLAVPKRTMVSAEARAENEQLQAETMEKIGTFSTFCDAIVKQLSKHIILFAILIFTYLKPMLKDPL